MSVLLLASRWGHSLIWLVFGSAGARLAERGLGQLGAAKVEASWPSWRGRAVEPLIRVSLSHLDGDSCLYQEEADDDLLYDWDMRTTVTLDSRAEALVRKAMALRNESVEEIVNQAVVDALTAVEATPFSTQPYDLGAAIDMTKALQLSGDLEDQEIAEKMRLGK